jgi:hypothetical protein
LNLYKWKIRFQTLLSNGSTWTATSRLGFGGRADRLSAQDDRREMLGDEVGLYKLNPVYP